jgi:hypothetical protein
MTRPSLGRGLGTLMKGGGASRHTADVGAAALLLGQIVCLLLPQAVGFAADSLPDIRSIAPDLKTPPMIENRPGAGKRVREVAPGYEHTRVYHALFLPEDWAPGKQFPVSAEYAGNGNYSNAFGDVSRGTVDGSNLGYGITGGRGCIWVCLPYVAGSGGGRTNSVTWWGDPEETASYCRIALRDIFERYGGDPRRTILAGFSRGAIACNFIGLRDDVIAPLWAGFIAHSHYDGVRTNWGYAGADRASALERLRRLNGRPQFISHEGSIDATRNYVAGTGLKGDFSFLALPYRNHTDEWVLRDVPERRVLREWFKRVVNQADAPP